MLRAAKLQIRLPTSPHLRVAGRTNRLDTERILGLYDVYKDKKLGLDTQTVVYCAEAT